LINHSKMIPCLQKSHHPFTRYEIWSLYIEYLKHYIATNVHIYMETMWHNLEWSALKF
jgi:hypothetical protein